MKAKEQTEFVLNVDLRRGPFVRAAVALLASATILGDWGSVVADAMVRQKPAGLLGIHINMPADVAQALKNGYPASAGLSEKALTRDEMLDDITSYWLTNTAASSAQLYWENNNNNFNAAEQKTAEFSIPVAITVFPGEIYRAPKTGPSAPTTSSSTSMSSTRAVTSRRGISRNSSLQRCARRSSHCADAAISQGGCHDRSNALEADSFDGTLRISHQQTGSRHFPVFELNRNAENTRPDMRKFAESNLNNSVMHNKWPLFTACPKLETNG